MSKGADGPSAQSFENPRKVGWLHKHGGSGMSSHWKKRWFIVDHHYLFYFKGPNDKKPVGILCLPEYQSCHKADSKECKKSYSFVLERSDSESSAKNYVLYAESESEMEKWLAAIREEMKPLLGDLTDYSNSYSKSSTPKPKIDQKAFDEVTACASEGPKLSHPTASRPKPRGRRPPKKYAVFHEDDNDSPTITPSSSSTSLSVKAPPTSPAPSSASPISSPRNSKKGNQPSTPMLPKPPMTPPTKSKTSTLEKAESGNLSPKPPVKPEPPKKVPSKDRQDLPSSPDIVDIPKVEPKVPPKPRPPVVPKKPLPATPTESLVHIEVTATEEPVETRSSPSLRPKPMVPRAKPRTPSVGLTKSTEVPELPGNEVAAPPPGPTPQPKPRRSMSPEPEVVVPLPTKKPKPVPVKRKPTGKALVTMPSYEEDKQKKLLDEVPSEVEKVTAAESVDLQKPEVEEEVEQNKEEQVQSPLSLNSSSDTPLDEKEEAKVQETEDKKKKDEATLAEKMAENEESSDKEKDSPSAEQSNGDIGENAVTEVEKAIDDTTYENIQHDMEDTAKEKKTEDDEKSYEDMNYKSSDKSTKLEANGTEEDPNQIAYVEITPALPDANLSKDTSNTYEPVDTLSNDIDDSKDYEVPQDWNTQDIASARSSGGFIPMGLTPDFRSEEAAIYDVPPPARLAVNDRPSSTATADSSTLSQAQETESRSNSMASSSSSSSKHSSDVPPPSSSRPVVAGIIVTEQSTDSNLEQRIESLEDSIEKAGSSLSEDKGKPSNFSDFYDKRETETVAKALQQAKEILRLAKVAKDEADQLKEEAVRELDLAKRERHDASILKKNAAEILKIAKTKLGK